MRHLPETEENGLIQSSICQRRSIPALYSGFLIRARIFHDAGGVAIIAESDGSLPSFWVNDIFPPDGEWHVVYVPFTDFKVGPGGAGDQNTRLRPDCLEKD